MNKIDKKVSTKFLLKVKEQAMFLAEEREEQNIQINMFDFTNKLKLPYKEKWDNEQFMVNLLYAEIACSQGCSSFIASVIMNNEKLLSRYSSYSRSVVSSLIKLTTVENLFTNMNLDIQVEVGEYFTSDNIKFYCDRIIEYLE